MTPPSPHPGRGYNARDRMGRTVGAADVSAGAVPATASAGPAPVPSEPRHAPTTIDGVPRLVRPADTRVLAGVAAGIADHLRASVVLVRAVFVVLALLAGAGVVGYALLWIFVPQDDGPAGPATARDLARSAPGSAAAQRRMALGIAALGVGVAIGALALGIGQWVSALVGPLVIVAIGAAFIWREADDSKRMRWRRTAAGFARPRLGAWWRVAAGVVLVVGGLAVYAIAQVDVASARSAVIAVVLTLIGVAVIAIPWLTRLLRDLTDERRERIRESEKAEVAAHLHDSVLQTLALIQRQPDDAREVQRLARAQERDLRAWLYGPSGYTRPGSDRLPQGETGAGSPVVAGGSTAASSYLMDRTMPGGAAQALTRMAAEVEDTYAVSIAPVIVGDAPPSDRARALLSAAREAMVNAAKHSGVREISVYAEFEDTRATAFVRDRGCGFDPGSVAADRRGVSQSIRGRMERYGGQADVRATPGSGTEWTLTMPAAAHGSDRPEAD